MATTALAEQLQEQRRSVASLASTPTSCLDGEALLGGLDEVLALKHAVDALHGQLALAAEQTGAVTGGGARNAPIWVGANTGSAPHGTRAAVRRARWLLDYPEFRLAFVEGRLSVEHIELLRRAETPVTCLALRDDQAQLVEAAETCRFRDFKTVLQYWINAVDPDGTIPKDQQRKNAFSIRRYGDGSVTVKGRLDPILGTKLHNALMAESEKRWRNEPDNPDSAAAVPRGQAQRHAEALVGLIERGHQNTEASTTDPLLHVVLSQRVAEDLAAGRVLHLDPFDVDGRCEFLDGTPLHPCLAARLMAAANVRRVVLDARSQVLDVSVKARLFPRWMKQAALVGTRGQCSEPGCDAPTHWIHADHVVPHSKHGKTRFDNLDPLCAPANAAKADTIPPLKRRDDPDNDNRDKARSPAA